MSDWRDVMEARSAAEDNARKAIANTQLQTFATVHALLAVAAEIRALGVTLDYVTGDVQR